MADGMNPEDFLSELESFKDELGFEKPDLTSGDAASIGGLAASDLDALFAESDSAAQQPPPAPEPPERGRRKTQAAAVASTADGRRSNDKRRVAGAAGGGAAATTKATRPPDDRGSIIKLLVAAVVTVLVLSWIATSCLGDDGDSVATTDESSTTTTVESSTTSAPTTTAATTTTPAATGASADDANAALQAAGITGALATADGSTIVLSGSVDSEEQKAAAETAVAGLDGVETVDNQLVVEATRDLAAEANQALIDAGIPGVSAAVEGELATLTGEAANGEQRLAAELAVLTIAGIESVDNQISVPPTAAEILTTTLNDLVKLNPILFSTGSADIRDSSKPTLDEAATIIIANPAGAVEIGGHTDNDGGADANRELSQDRAQSVLDYLVSKGVDANRLSAVGYGEDSPLVPNSSGDNKRKNRRIEFKVS